MHQRILSISECLHLYVFVSPHKNDKVWLVSDRLSLGRGVNRKSKPCRPVMFSGIGGDSSYIETEHVRDQGWHIIESSMSASMISITNGRGLWSPEKVCAIAPAGRVTQAPWLQLPSKELSDLGDSQRSLPPVRLDQLSQDAEEAPGSTVHC